MKIIGITGSFKTGKTTVLNIFKDLGVEIIDADKVAHKQFASEEVIAAIRNHFQDSAEVVEGNIINRSKLAQIVFNNQSELKWLNNLIHPLVAKDIENLLKEIKKRNPEALAAIEIPLLYEAGMTYLVDKIVVVSVDRQTQLRRALKEGFSRENALRRIESQFDILKKEERGDFVIDNKGSLENTGNQVEKIWKKIKE